MSASPCEGGGWEGVHSWRKYLRRIKNSLGKKAEEFLITDNMLQAAELGRIHAKAA